MRRVKLRRRVRERRRGRQKVPRFPRQVHLERRERLACTRPLLVVARVDVPDASNFRVARAEAAPLERDDAVHLEPLGVVKREEDHVASIGAPYPYLLLGVPPHEGVHDGPDVGLHGSLDRKPLAPNHHVGGAPARSLPALWGGSEYFGSGRDWTENAYSMKMREAA